MNENTPETGQRKDKKELFLEFCRSHWEGRRDLLSALGIIGFLGSFVVVIVALIAAFVLPDLLPWVSSGFYLFFGIFLLITTPYMVFAWVSIWRCAPNTEWDGWTYGARAIVVIWILLYLWMIFS